MVRITGDDEIAGAARTRSSLRPFWDRTAPSLEGRLPPSWDGMRPRRVRLVPIRRSRAVEIEESFDPFRHGPSSQQARATCSVDPEDTRLRQNYGALNYLVAAGVRGTVRKSAA